MILKYRNVFCLQVSGHSLTRPIQRGDLRLSRGHSSIPHDFKVVRQHPDLLSLLTKHLHSPILLPCVIESELLLMREPNAGFALGSGQFHLLCHLTLLRMRVFLTLIGPPILRHRCVCVLTGLDCASHIDSDRGRRTLFYVSHGLLRLWRQQRLAYLESGLRFA